jgi:hypothetical protein
MLLMKITKKIINKNLILLCFNISRIEFMIKINCKQTCSIQTIIHANIIQYINNVPKCKMILILEWKKKTIAYSKHLALT